MVQSVPVAVSELLGKSLSSESQDTVQNCLGSILELMEVWNSAVDNDNRLFLLETFYNRIDEAVRALSPKLTPSCGAGCSACCHLNTDISSIEADYIVNYLEEQGMTPDIAYMVSQVGLDKDTHPYATNSACTFLGPDKRCTIYDARPTACRKYLVVSDPTLCDVKYHGTRQVANIFIQENEMIASALMNLKVENGPLPLMVLKSLDKLKQTTTT